MVNFAFWAPLGPIQAYTMLRRMEIFGYQVHAGAHCTLLGSHSNCSVLSPSHQGDIPLEIRSFLAHPWVCQNTPFGTPISTPDVVSWTPHICMPMWSLDPIRSLVLRYESYVQPPIPLAMGSALAANATRGNCSSFAYLCHFCTKIWVSPTLQTA